MTDYRVDKHHQGVGQWLWHIRAIASDARDSNLVIGNFYGTYLLWNFCRKDENEEKETGNGPFRAIESFWNDQIDSLKT